MTVDDEKRPVPCPKGYRKNGEWAGGACFPDNTCYKGAAGLERAVKDGDVSPNGLGGFCRRHPSVIPGCPNR